ncbi:MAG: hypothetical protein FJY65_03275 [Calditrichaeota bacterium]|nr:hypothetical protein [Calditrichota bacterium]
MKVPDFSSETNKFKFLKPAAYSVSIWTKVPFEKEQLLRSIIEFAKKFPEFDDFEADKDGSRLKLGYKTSITDEEYYFRIMRNCSFEFVWGPSVKINLDEFISRLINEMQNILGISLLHIEGVDYKYYTIYNLETNISQLVWNTYFSNSPLNQALDLEMVNQDNFGFRGILDKQRVYIIGFESNVADKEVIEKKFSNDRLTITCGIALVRDISINAGLDNIINRHLDIASKLIRERFLPYIIEPMDRAIEEIENSKLSEK